jgi:hypothetical protein
MVRCFSAACPGPSAANARPRAAARLILLKYLIEFFVLGGGEVWDAKLVRQRCTPMFVSRRIIFHDEMEFDQVEATLDLA